MAFPLFGKQTLYTFTGPLSSPVDLEDRAGVYAILDATGECPPLYRLLGVGQAALVRSAVEAHSRRACWFARRRGSLAYAAAYTVGTSERVRQAIEQDIQAANEVVCQE